MLPLAIFIVIWAIISTVVIMFTMRDYKRRFGSTPDSPEEWIIGCVPLVLVSAVIASIIWAIVMIASGFTLDV